MTISQLYTCCLKPERFKRSHVWGRLTKGEIQTTTAGGLWGAYLMTVAHFCERGSVVWCGVVWCGVVWYGVVWCGVVWCGVLCCVVVCCGVVFCGLVCDVACYDDV